MRLDAPVVHGLRVMELGAPLLVKFGDQLGEGCLSRGDGRLPLY